MPTQKPSQRLEILALHGRTGMMAIIEALAAAPNECEIAIMYGTIPATPTPVGCILITVEQTTAAMSPSQARYFANLLMSDPPPELFDAPERRDFRNFGAVLGDALDEIERQTGGRGEATLH